MKIKEMIFGIKGLSFKETLEYLTEKVQKSEEKIFVVTINPEIIMLAMKDSEYEKVLKSADLALSDGVGVLWAGKIFGKSFKGRVHGVDLVERLCGEVSKKPITVGFLGGEENVAQNTADCLTKKYPGLKVAFALKEWDLVRGPATRFPPASAHSRYTDFALSGSPSTLVTPHEANSCDILFVAFGSPKQEKWIYEHMKEIDAKIFIGVGGAFDFISGKVPRAPVFVRRLGLEWLFRLVIQPWRIKRQFALVKFIFYVVWERLF